MTLTDEDRRRLRTLVENAMAEVDCAVQPGAMVQPDSVESAMSLMRSYDWGREFLRRLEESA